MEKHTVNNGRLNFYMASVSTKSLFCLKVIVCCFSHYCTVRVGSILGGLH
jgi:hypothetical protein